MRPLFDNWQIWAVLSALFAALTAVFGKIGVERIDPNFATLIRTLVILCLVAAIVLMTGAGQSLTLISTKSYAFLVLSGLATGVSWLCYYRALKLGPASQVAPIDKMSVVLVALLGVFLLGESLSLRNWLGIALITAGAMLVALKA